MPKVKMEDNLKDTNNSTSTLLYSPISRKYNNKETNKQKVVVLNGAKKLTDQQALPS